MIISKYLQKLFFLLMMGGALCTLQACGDDEEDEPVQKPNEEETVKPDDGKEEEKPSDKPSDTMEAVDLGLPSGTLWATCNVGASSPEEYGGYYAWGETEEKEDYDLDTYKYYLGDLDGDGDNFDSNEYVDIGSNISDTQYDVAHMKWGGSWRMPTRDEIKELVNHCTWKWTTYNNINGQLVTGPNSNSIFLPAAGYRDGTDSYGSGSGGYWSATSYESYGDGANGLYFSSSGSAWDYWGSDLGRTVRPVKTGEKPSVDIPSENENVAIAEAIDLGLSVKWASHNVGATSPEGYGGYYAWGETEEKKVYDWSTYKWCNGSNSTLTKYCIDNKYGTVDNKTVLELSDDVAHVKWGGDWRMPTYSEFTELFNRCTWKWTTYNGIKGQMVTGPNGKSIFLPASGTRMGENLDNRGKYGDYWTVTPNEEYNYSVHALDFFDTHKDFRNGGRCFGFTVRPVCD